MPKFMTVAYGAVAAAAVALALSGHPVAPVAIAPVRSNPVTAAPQAEATNDRPAPPAWSTPDADALPDDGWGRTVRHGRDLIVRTYALIGPEVVEPSHRFSGNNLACQSCHLEAGTKQYGLPFQGVYADFPNYRARSGAVGTIEDRIQGCMTRSMNGKQLPPGGPEMTAIVAYMKFLSDGRTVGAPTPGRGPGRMPELSRAADPAHGKQVYAQNCVACHGVTGQGQRAGVVGDAKGYTFPPLWGPDSFNDGAGMNRLIGAANFIHGNMPNGINWQSPVLSEQDAWDVAAFVQAQPRPHKANLDRDYPVALQRPADSGYGPYVDGLSQEQHQLGPFGPIRARISELTAAAKAAAVGPAR